jgi:ABC-type multidrug transport system fused ATPase/permease subunit
MDEDTSLYYVSIYALLSLFALLLGLGNLFWGLWSALRASRKLHDTLLLAVLGAPVRFFEKTPVGRLLNRFTKVRNHQYQYM